MKQLFLLPVCLIGLVIVSNAQEKNHPPPPPPPEPPTIVLTRYVPPTSQLKEFYSKNPGVEGLYWKSENEIVVVHKDKTQYVYNMNDGKQKEAFKEKYGTTHINTPPPPPPPPAPPKKKHQS
jgi:hypothetical protein